MNLPKLVLRNLEQRPLSSILTSASVALGVMLIVAILVLRAEMEESFMRPGRGFSLVVGPPGGSRLELVLNTVYHVGESAGLMPVRVLEELRSHPSARLAVPYAVGDSFRGFRVVATTDDFFDPVFPQPEAETREGKLAEGRRFRFDQHLLEEALAAIEERRTRRSGDDSSPHGQTHAHEHDHEEVAEAVLGADVAATLGIQVGDRIEPTHGVEGGKEHKDEHLWTVVGILKRTWTPIDRVVLINLDSFYRIPDHGNALIPGTGEAGLSAIVLFPKPGIHKGLLLPRLRNRAEFQVAEVHEEMRAIRDLVGNVDQVFLLVAILVVIIGVVGVMVAIYNTMNERRREIAILRAIGARSSTVMLAIMAEATALTALGGVLGLLLGHGLIAAFAGRVEEASNVRPDALNVLPEELLVLGLVTLVGAIAGLIPAAKAYRTDVASNLAPTV